LNNVIIFLLLLLFINNAFTQNPDKVAYAVRTPVAPRIDGILSDTVWNNAVVISDFIQSMPKNDTKPTFKTEVRILYDNYAIYVGAFLYDDHPDSIYKEMGNRDDDLNADEFYIGFDTYNNQQDAFIFGVTASGVQADFREQDETYNAVWQSEVKILEKGWSVEMKIPYSALRFPKNAQQLWGMQIYRNLRRYREDDEWALHKKGASNELIYWGKLKGISNIKAPLRLSLTPYLFVGLEHYPYNNPGESNYSSSFSGGLDLKYGINESFTLDMSLLPDFSQVQSDNQVKNLSAFEVVYSEQRPFFLEAVDLFAKGDLFYSRRIGRMPQLYFSVEDSLKAGEYISKNPLQAKLLNATKLSGRNKNGLALGFFNAVTDNTYATIEDSLKNKRKILTEPLTNYNILVFDQALKNNSSFYIANTNVLREGKEFKNANVTASGAAFYDKSNTYLLSLSGALSQQYDKIDSIKNIYHTTTGYKYYISTAKVAGNFQMRYNLNRMNDTYNANDLGITRFKNYSSNGGSISYNIYEPFGIFRNFYNNVYFERVTNFKTGKLTDLYSNIYSNTTFTNYLTVWLGLYKSFSETFEYYEPARSGLEDRFRKTAGYYGLNTGFSSDYRKKISLDMSFNFNRVKRDSSEYYYIALTPIFRLSSKFTMNYSISVSKSFNSLGYVDFIDTSQTIIYGNRNIQTIINTINSKYMFKNDLFISIRLRDYWSMGEYNRFYTLGDDGYLIYNAGYNTNNNFNFNAFNIDLVFGWQFAPGSSLSIVWKNAIMKEEQDLIYNFFDNISHTFDAPQQNLISLKFLYYLDYQSVKKKNI